MSLKIRFVLLIALVAMVFLGLSIAVMDLISERIVDRWTLQLVERETSHNRDYSIKPITKEIALVKAFAANPIVVSWAQDANNPALQEQALDYLNGHRVDFNDSSYFIALKGNGGYYYNNAKDEFLGRELTYTLDASNIDDGWFFTSLESSLSINLNVDYDRGLKQTKLWINYQIEDNGEVLGVIGTGFSLQGFVDAYINDSDKGFDILFLDGDGAIQLSTANSAIVRAAIAKTVTEKTLIFDYLEDSETPAELRKAFDKVSQSPDDIELLLVNWKGRESVLGITYLPSLNWYQVNVVDAEYALPTSDFYPLYAIVIVAMLALLLAVYLAVLRYIDGPLRFLKMRIEHMNQPKAVASMVIPPLSLEFAQLNDQLERFAFYDPLTGLLNRRGLKHNFELQVAHARRRNTLLSVVMVDIDRFKAFNDTYGHLAGDEAIKVVANVLTNHFQRSTDIVGRFGGEEFVVVAEDTSENEVFDRVEACREAIKQQNINFGELTLDHVITVSFGGVSAQQTGSQSISMQMLLDRADEQLYKAKQHRDKTAWARV